MLERPDHHEPGWPPDDLFRDMVESIDAVAYVFRADDPGAPPVYISSQTERVLGLTRAELMHPQEALLGLTHPEDRDRTRRLSAEAAGTGRFDAEYRLALPEGQVRWVRNTASLIPRTEERPALWFGLVYDITDSKRGEDALRESETKYRALVEQTPAVVYIDTDEAYPETLYISQEIGTLMGYTPQEWIDDRLWQSTLHPADRERMLREWAEAVAKGGPFELVYRMLCRDGSTIWVRDKATPIRNPDGTTLYWQGLFQDITANKLAEEVLRRSESRYRSLVEQVPAVVYEMGPDDERRTLYVSPHVEEILGYSRREWLEQPDIWTELLHPDDRENELAAHDEHTRTGEPWRREYRLIASDGRVVWVSDQAKLTSDSDGSGTWHGVMLDISAQKDAEESLQDANELLELRVLSRTAELEEANEMMSLEIGERRRVEAELRRAEERFRRLVEEVPAVVYVWDVQTPPDSPDSNAYISPQIQKLLGFTATEWVTGALWRERIHPHDRERIFALSEGTAQTGEPYADEYRYLAKDGRVVWVLDRVSLLSRNVYGRPWLFQGVLVDITARREAEAKAIEIETWYRRLTEESPGLTWVVSGRDEDPDVRWRHFYISPRSRQLLGYEPAAFSAPPEGWHAWVHPDDRERVIRENLAIWRTGVAWVSDFRMISRDGRVVWIHLEGRAVDLDEKGAPTSYQAVMLDVTREREEHEALIEEQGQNRSLLNGMPGIAWTELVDPVSGTSRFSYIAPQVQKWTGYSPRELMEAPGRTERLIHPRDRARFRARSAEADASGEWEDLFRLICRDGSPRWFHSVGTRVSAPGEVPHVWQGVAVPLGTDFQPILDATGSPGFKVTVPGPQESRTS